MLTPPFLPLKGLRVFEVVANHLHMAKAGEQLGVTQGAVSQQIRNLENHLGVKLFSRANNRLTLTPEGQRLHLSVKTGFEILVDGTRNLNPNDLSGSLVIATTQTIATSWANELICQFYQKYPTMQITVREIEPRQLDIPSDIDVSICYGEPKAPDRDIKLLASPPLYPVCNPKLIQQIGRITRPSDIYKYTLIHDHQVSWERWQDHYNVNEIRSSSDIYFPNTSQALTVARLGYGVALANSVETKEFIREGQLVRLLEKPVEEERSYYLLTRKASTQSLKAKIFEEWIIENLETV